MSLDPNAKENQVIILGVMVHEKNSHVSYHDIKCISVLNIPFTYRYFYLPLTGLQDSDDDMEEVSHILDTAS